MALMSLVVRRFTQGDPLPEHLQRRGPPASLDGREVVLGKPDRDEDPKQRHRGTGCHDRRRDADRPAEKAECDHPGRAEPPIRPQEERGVSAAPLPSC